MKIASLKKNYEFRRVYSRGRSAATANMVLYCRRNRSSLNRLGLTVGAQLGCAVKRNLVRRRLREVYRLNADKLRSGYDLVVVVRSRGISAAFRALETDFLSLAGKLGVIR